MSKSSTAISLVLITAASAGFIGYQAVHSPPDPAFSAGSDDDSGADFGDDPLAPPTTNPSTRPSTFAPNSSPYYYHDYSSNHYYSWGHPRYSGGNSVSRSHADNSHSSGSHLSGTSRGGFGSTGHAMSHAGS